MACPYFMPLERLENGNWPHPSRLPLGGGWRGHCTAPGHEGETPSQDILEAFCNLGYADCCAWSPRERPWDAVRFAVLAAPGPAAPGPAATGSMNAERNGKGREREIRLRYVCERSHRPVTDGMLRFDLTQMIWVDRHDDPRLQKMAECFLESYLKKKM